MCALNFCIPVRPFGSSLTHLWGLERGYFLATQPLFPLIPCGQRRETSTALPPSRPSPTTNACLATCVRGCGTGDGVVFPCLPPLSLLSYLFPLPPNALPHLSCGVTDEVSILRKVCSFSRVFWGTSIVLVCAPTSFFVLGEREPSCFHCFLFDSTRSVCHKARRATHTHTYTQSQPTPEPQSW